MELHSVIRLRATKVIAECNSALYKCKNIRQLV